jgi:hypothetical protein
MKAILLSFSLLLASIASAASTKPADEFVEIKAGAAITVRPDRAYLLFRTNSKNTRIYVGMSPVFLRIPTAEEMERYDAAKRAAFVKAQPDLKRRREALIAQKAAAESTGRTFAKAIPPIPSVETFDFVYDEIRNIHSVNLARALEKPDDGTVMLIEAVPGNYVLYGWGIQHLLHTCLCLGTVTFPAEAGKITDLGTLLVAPASEPSSIPELKAVTGLGPSMNGHAVLFASAIRPADGSSAIPSVLAGKPIAPADYRATGEIRQPLRARHQSSGPDCGSARLRRGNGARSGEPDCGRGSLALGTRDG